MPERTLLYLGGPAQAAAQLWRLRDGQTAECLYEGPWPIEDPAILSVMRTMPPWVVMPDHRGSLLWLDIPSRRREQARRALAFALEDWLIDDPAEMHATLGTQPLQDGERWRWPVLLVESRWRNELLQALDAMGVQPRALVHPLDIEPRPDASGEWVVTRDSDRDLLRVIQGRHAGFILPPDGRSVAERLLDAIEHLPAAERPKRLRCDGIAIEEIERLADRLTTPASEEIAVESGPAPRRPANWFEALANGTAISAFERPEASGAGLSRHAGTLVPLVLLLLAALVGLRVAEGWQASRQIEALDRRITADFRAALPDTRLVNPRVQIEQALENRTGNGDLMASRAFLPLLASVTAAMRGSDSHIERLNFESGRMDTHWRGPDYDRMQEGADRLRDDDRVRVTQVDAAVEGESARMQLTLELAYGKESQ